MKIEVKNFGKIKKGQVDLDKKVTVFVGYNNSGKTYMSQLLWGLSNFIFNSKYSYWNNYLPEIVVKDNTTILTNDMLSGIFNALNNHIKDDLLPTVFNVTKEYFEAEDTSIEYAGDFLSKIKKHSFEHYALIPIHLDSHVITETYSNYFHFKKESNSLTVLIEQKRFSTPLTRIEILNKGFEDTSSYFGFSLGDIYKMSFSEIIRKILFEDKKAPIFLPANRVFYPSYYKYVYSIAKDEKDLIDDRLKRNENVSSLRALSKRPYTKAMDDLIQKFYGLNNSLAINNSYQDLIVDLKEIIGGDIIIKSAEGIAPIEFYLKLEDGKELEMYMSSSSANQLTTLYLYLKYWAEPENNFLIIDEPEENLHPENQIKLVNILMKFADRGNKILITTHSPLITDHINNYANLSYLNGAGTDMAAMLENNTAHMASIKNIRHSDYGVYFFNGEGIKEYEVNDYGAYFRDFQTAQDKVKDVSDTLKENIYKTLHPNA